MDESAAINPPSPPPGAVSPNSGVATPVTGSYNEIRQDLFCQDCGYNLRGLTSNRCPECGRTLDAVRSTIPGIPWVHRRNIGRLSAYWQTVWLVMFRHKRFCEELARPVSYPDAQRFRWMTILHVYLPVLAATVIAYLRYWPAPFNEQLWNEAFAAVWPAVALHGCFVLFLAAATGAPSYFFTLRELPVPQQNSAIAMSYYATAALAWTPLALVLALAAMAVLPHRPVLGEALGALAIALPCAEVVAWCADIMHITGRLLPRRKWRALIVGGVIVALWAGLAGLIFTLIPLIILYVLIVLASLR